MKLKNLAIIISIATLTACGAGSGGGEPNTPPTTPTTPTTPTSPTRDAIAITGPTTALIGESVGLAVLLADPAENVSISWQQVSGPEVDILASHSQAIGFDVTAAGNYTFQVTARDSNTNQILTESHSFSVTEQLKTANVRLDHAVVERGPVSLRVDAPTDDSIASVVWRQLSGPSVSLSSLTQQDNFLFFEAPSVSNDEIIEFEATITTANGINDSDNVLVLVKNAQINNDGYFPGVADSVVYNEMFPYRSNSPYANALQACVYNNLVASSCSFSQLPLIGQVTETPTIDDVLNRLLVSHQWMGDRFKAYLESSVAAPDMLALLRGVTAIVISYEVRPSFYWVATGAIYLDARNFWVSPEERDTLNDIPDYRTGFGNDLQFLMPWRYVKNGQEYLNRGSYPQDQRLSRSFADVEADITWLMYHELAHANDFFPPDIHSSLSSGQSPLSYYNNNDARSTTFASRYPLLSTEMRSLADVRFRGNSASAQQKAYTAEDIELFFVPDDAAMFYSYVTIREDYATLFERFMMAYRFDALGDTAIMSKVDNPNYAVTWGQRNRIMEEDIQPRVLYSVANVYPELPALEILNTFNEPQTMVPGTGWFENLVITPGKNSQASRSFPNMVINDVLLPHQGRPGVPEQ